jgi:hypothetical protein
LSGNPVLTGRGLPVAAPSEAPSNWVIVVRVGGKDQVLLLVLEYNCTMYKQTYILEQLLLGVLNTHGLPVVDKVYCKMYRSTLDTTKKEE